ncbi:MAG: hypothetical protein KY468_10955 [Armatimonadetes bacterium]|nr:hypothetical protein [Armatimonadota bacterium]
MYPRTYALLLISLTLMADRVPMSPALAAPRPAPNRPAPARTAPARPATAPPGAASLRVPTGPTTEVTLERQPGFAPGPAYKIVLRRDGTALYTGHSNADRIGQFRGTISRSEFDRLSSLIQAFKFFSLRDRYAADAEPTDPRPESPGIIWEEPPAVVLSVTRGGTRKTVTSHWDAGPMELWTLGKAIQGIASEIRWTPTGTALKPSPNPAPNSVLKPTPRPGSATETVTPPARLGDGTSGLRGIVLDGPILYEGPGSERDPRPIQDAILLIRSPRTGQEVTRVRADANGRFEVSLPAGDYLLEFRDPKRPTQPNARVKATVSRGQYTDLILEAVADPKGETIIENPNVGETDF